MGTRFQRRVKLLPGVRLNISGSGASLTVGVPGASINIGQRGIYGNVGAPGTGLSHRRRLDTAGDSHRGPSPRPRPRAPSFDDPRVADATPDEPIASAPLDSISSESLAEFAESCAVRFAALPSIQQQFARAQTEYKFRREKERAGAASWFTRTFRRRHLSSLTETANAAREAVVAANAELEGLLVELDMDLAPSVAEAVAALSSAFAELTQASRTWDITGRSDVDSVKERSSASSSVMREAVTLDSEQLPIFRTSAPTFHFQNANGGDLYLYPGFLALAEAQALTLLAISEVEIVFSSTRFLEEEFVPPDAEVVGQTWLRVNKDGKPDKRFKENPQIPIVEYGTLDFTSSAGLRERYMVSSKEAAKAFATAFDALKVATQ